MMHRMILTTLVLAIFSAGSIGCVISIKDRSHHHPDRCYDYHPAWELERVVGGGQCLEFEITIGDGGYWYQPRGGEETQQQFHLLKADGSGTVVGPES